jgi:hypothetical protein
MLKNLLVKKKLLTNNRNLVTVSYIVNVQSFYTSVLKILVPNSVNKVNSDIGLSYWPASPCRLARRYNNPEYMNSATG